MYIYIDKKSGAKYPTTKNLNNEKKKYLFFFSKFAAFYVMKNFILFYVILYRLWEFYNYIKVILMALPQFLMAILKYINNNANKIVIKLIFI